MNYLIGAVLALIPAVGQRLAQRCIHQRAQQQLSSSSIEILVSPSSGRLSRV
jgi:hypothetical protein